MRTYAKALVGALVAGLSVLQQGLDADGISAQEWMAAAIAALVALGAIWAVPNAPQS